MSDPEATPEAGQPEAPPEPEAAEDWRTPGRHYVVGLGCSGLVVLAVVGFYLWRFLG